METPRQTQGSATEDAAARYLQAGGFTILERNYKSKLGEIDIVAEKGRVVHIVEVKSGSSQSPYFRPEQNLHPRQRQRLLRSAQAYLAYKHLPVNQEWQIDLVTVELRAGDTPVIEHYERAITG